MCSEAGTFGSPGIVMIDPVIATMNSAPLHNRNCLTVNVCPDGALTLD